MNDEYKKQFEWYKKLGFSDEEAKKKADDAMISLSRMQQNQTYVTQARPSWEHNPNVITLQQKKQQDKLQQQKQDQANALTFGWTPHRNDIASEVGAQDISMNMLGAVAGEGLLQGAPRLLAEILGHTNFGRALYVNRALNEAVEATPSYITTARESLPIVTEGAPVSPFRIGVRDNMQLLQRSPKVISMTERLGLPKGVRGNLTRIQKEALEDLEWYIENGQYRQHPKWNGQEIEWQSKVDPNTMQIFSDFRTTPKKGVYWGASRQGGVFRASVDAGEGTAQIEPFTLTTGDKVKLTPPAVETGDYSLSTTLSPDIMKKFWPLVQMTRKPCTYFSGDQIEAPLGAQLIRTYQNIQREPYTMTYPTWFDPKIGDIIRIPNSKPFPRRRNSLNDIIKNLFQNYKWAEIGDNVDGLSPDSYMAILKQGQRPGYRLRFNINEPMTGWNNTAVQNKWLYDLFEKTKTGEVPQEEFISQFNEWVKPYNGMEARIIKNEEGQSIIGIPHPFVFKEKKGGSIHINPKNKGKFTETKKRTGKTTEELTHSKNPLTRKRAIFAQNAKKWKH